MTLFTPLCDGDSGIIGDTCNICKINVANISDFLLSLPVFDILLKTAAPKDK